MQYKATIIGAQGYAGRELARLLLTHPQIQLAQVFSRNADWHLSHDLPEAASALVKHTLFPEVLSDLSNACQAMDIIFLATPHEVSLQCVPHLYDGKKIIVDLSGAFRLPVGVFEEWYQHTHSATDLLASAQFGLCPQQTDNKSTLIANPGCYATAILMALLPLAQAGLVNDAHIIVDAKSGISGAGRSAKTELLFGEIDNNFFPYKIGAHQHTPEIENTIQQLANVKTQITLTTQVLPIQRGIAASLYIPLQGNKEEVIEQIKNAYQKAYGDYSLVRYAYLPDLNAKEKQLFLSLKNVIGTCRTHISYQIVNNYIVVFSMIDNLLKGAASQAIENANRLCKLPLTSGLEHCQGIL